jgi:hypothetical protein
MDFQPGGGDWKFCRPLSIFLDYTLEPLTDVSLVDIFFNGGLHMGQTTVEWFGGFT